MELFGIIWWPINAIVWITITTGCAYVAVYGAWKGIECLHKGGKAELKRYIRNTA